MLFSTSFSLTNDIDRLSNVPNGPVTNGVMTYATPSESSFVADRSYNDRLSSHNTQAVTTDTNGSTAANSKENGRNSGENCNNSSSPALATDGSSVNQHQHDGEESENHVSKVEGEEVVQEEAPEKSDEDDTTNSSESNVPTEQKDPLTEEGAESLTSPPS